MARTGRGAKVALIAVAGFGDARRRDERRQSRLAQKLGEVGRRVAAEVACSVRNASKPDAAARAGLPRQGRASLDGGDDPSRGLFTKRERRPPCPTLPAIRTRSRPTSRPTRRPSTAVGSAVRPEPSATPPSSAASPGT